MRQRVVRKPLFSLGQVLATKGIQELMQSLAGLEFEEHLVDCLACHQKGNWGVVPKEDAKENDSSVKNGNRIISSYYINPNEPIKDNVFWIITEADRSVTTFLLPSEY